MEKWLSVMKILDLGKNLCRRFRADRSGQVALTFAFAVIPMLGLAGLTMDYGNSLGVQSQLNAAADQAALEGVSTSGNPNMTLPTQATVAPYFYAAAANIPNVTINSVTVNASTSVNSLFVTVSYTATVTTEFSNVMGVSSFTVSRQCLGRSANPEIRHFLSAARQFALDGACCDDRRYHQHAGGHSGPSSGTAMPRPAAHPAPLPVTSIRSIRATRSPAMIRPIAIISPRTTTSRPASTCCARRRRA